MNGKDQRRLLLLRSFHHASEQHIAADVKSRDGKPVGVSHCQQVLHVH